MSGPIKRHHHTTPRVYLRGFADEDHMVSIRRRTGEEKNLHINNVSVRKNFYNFHNSAGVEVGAIEEWLGNDVENLIGPVLVKLRAGSDVEADDVETIATFVVSQLLRTPSTEALLVHLDTQLGPLLLAHSVLNKSDLDPTRMSAADMDMVMRIATQVWEERTSDDRRSRLRTIMRKIDELAEQLATWHWSVLSADEQVLISGDAPVATYHEPGRAWGGIIPPGSPVYLPLTPQRLLVGERHTLGESSGALSEQLAAMVSARIALQAADTILKSPTQTWPRDLVLLPEPPPAPQASVTWGRSSGESPTFPARYPEVSSPEIKSLLEELEATDVVE